MLEQDVDRARSLMDLDWADLYRLRPAFSMETQTLYQLRVGAFPVWSDSELPEGPSVDELRPKAFQLNLDDTLTHVAKN